MSNSYTTSMLHLTGKPVKTRHITQYLPSLLFRRCEMHYQCRLNDLGLSVALLI
ncbi:hypothetical protein ACPUVO_15160 [Pseudocolwellia sp. HL-MZ19]|uniref:hypothetical protein n=1 Tax=Pseudocolwellia sp. HL-MZ19 TaxID=3400846 RepID=UPI003CE843AD